MKETVKRTLISVLVAVLILVSIVTLTPKKQVEAAVGDQETISILPVDYNTGPTAQANAWAGRQKWLADAAMKYYNPIKGTISQNTFASASNLWTSLEGYQGYMTSFMTEVFKDSNGKWVYCFDKGTPAEGTRYIGDTLPSGYTLVSEDKLIEIALVAEALFPQSADLSVFRANISRIFKPAYQAKATAMFNGADGNFGAALIIQAMVWKEVHNIDFCSINDGKFDFEGGQWVEPKTGEIHYGIPSTYRGLTTICDVMNFNELYRLGLELIQTGEGAVCHNIELNYQERKSYTGKVAEAITVAHDSGKLPSGIAYEKVGTTVYLTSNINENKDFGEIKAGGISGTFSSSRPYNKGVSGQLIVKTHQVKNVCLRVKANALGSGKLKKVSSDPAATEGNSFYSLAGAEYTVYSDKALTKSVGKLTTDENGNSNTLTDLVAGTYYVKETKEPKGFKKDPVVHELVIKAGETCTLTVKDVYETGSVKLKKVSAKPEYTENNPNYSLAGAEYTVYQDRGLTTPLSTLLVTDETGQSNTIENLVTGTYYVQETKASKGFVKNPKVYTIVVKPGETGTISSVEIPLDDPVDVSLKKQDQTTGEAAPLGDASLALAEFTFKFYAGDYAEGVDPATTGAAPDRTWVLRTNEKGEVYFRDADLSFTYDGQSYPYKVSGNDFYIDPLGQPTFPLGTLTVQETKAPEGYLLNDTVYVRKIEQDGELENVKTYNVPVVPEQVMLNKFKIEKFSTDGEQSEVLTPEEGAEFTAILKKYVDQYGSFEKALAEKETFGPHEWTTVITDSHGQGTSGDLAYGEYVIKQTGGDPEKDMLLQKLSFRVENNTDEPVTYKINNIPKEYYVKIVKVDEKTGERVILTGASFKIKNLDTGEYVSQKIGLTYYDTFKTTAETKGDIPAGTFYASGEELGSTVTPLRLLAGNYQLEEVENPTGYTILDKPIPFTVSHEDATTGEGENDEYIEVVAENTPQYGELVLNKQGEQFKEWVDETVTLKVQAEGITETVTKEVPRANESLIIERRWTETKEVEELVEVSPAVIDEETGEIIVPAVEEIIKKTIEEEHFDTHNGKTYENGAYSEAISEKGTYRVLDKNNEVVQEVTLAEGETGEILVELAPELVEEEVKREGEVSDKTYTYKKAVFENGYLAGATFSLTAKEDIKSYDGQTVFYKEGDKLLLAQKDILIDGEVAYKRGEVITIPVLEDSILEDETLVIDEIATKNEPLTLSKIPLGKYLVNEDQIHYTKVKYIKLNYQFYIRKHDTSTKVNMSC